MIAAIDVYYKKDNTAKSVVVLYNWEDLKPKKIFTAIIDNVEAYNPGVFYKRELPCIVEVLKLIKIETVDILLIDGHVFIDNEKSYGLGGYVWEYYNKKTPVIGVAKRSFYNNKDTVIKVYRGESKNPLHISSIGIETTKAAQLIKKMKGKYRIPDVLKILDKKTKDNY